MVSKFSKYFTILFIILILYLSIRMFESYYSAIMAAVILSYISYPVFKKINKYIKNKNLAIFIMVFLAFIVVVVPVIIIINTLLKELVIFYSNFQSSGFNFSFELPDKFSFANQYLADATRNIASTLISYLTGLVSSLPQKLIAGIIMLFSMFVFLKNGPEILMKFKKIIPMEDLQKDQLLTEFRNVTKGVLFGMIISMFLQGVLGAIGFAIFGIPNPVLWGLIMSFLSFIPLIGVTPVYLGAVVYFFYHKLYVNMALMIVYGVIASNVDQIIISKVLGKKASLNPFLSLMGILGGIKLFGFIGIVAGPLVLSLLMAIIRFYTSNFKKEFSI